MLSNSSTAYKLGKVVYGQDFYGERRLTKARSFLDNPSGGSMFILGLGMTGKTSFLKQIEYMANNEEDYRGRFIIIYLDLQKVTEEEKLNLPIIRQQIMLNKAVKPLLKAKGVSTGLSDAEQVINKVISVATEENKTVVMLCDEIGRLMDIGKVGKKIGEIITKQLAIKDKQYFRVVAVSSPYMRATLEDDETPQWFRGLVKQLGKTPEATYYIDPLGEQDVLHLCYLRQRPGSIHVEEDIAKVALAKGGGHPHLIKIICTKILGGENIVNVGSFIGDDVRDNLDFARDVRSLFPCDQKVLGILTQGKKRKGTLAKATELKEELVADRLNHLKALGLVLNAHNDYMVACPFYSTWIQNLLNIQIKPKDLTVSWRWGVFSSLCANAGLFSSLVYIFSKSKIPGIDWLILVGCLLLFITSCGFSFLAVIPCFVESEKRRESLKNLIMGLAGSVGFCTLLSFIVNFLFFFAQSK